MKKIGGGGLILKRFCFYKGFGGSPGKFEQDFKDLKEGQDLHLAERIRSRSY